MGPVTRILHGVHARDTAGIGMGGSCRASRFCHSFFDARFLVYSFRREIQSPEFCSESWWPSEMPAAVGTDDLVHITAPGLGALSFLTMGD